MAERTFSLEEAQSLLPVLESLLRTAIDGKKLIESVDAELQEVAHRVFLNGGTFLNIVHFARRKAERDRCQGEQCAKDETGEKDGFHGAVWLVVYSSVLSVSTKGTHTGRN